MPIYEYTCAQCQTKFDHLARTMKSTADDNGVKCPDCGSPKTARVLSVFAVGAEGAKAGGGDDPMCGRCGGAPGSCGME